MEECNKQGQDVMNHLGCELVVIGGGFKNENAKMKVWTIYFE